MSGNVITYVGIDAHKKDLFIAMLVGDQTTPVTWQVANEPNAVRRIFYKSADYEGNNPHPLKARTAEEMAQIPTYYVMEKDKGMAATVAPFMPSADYMAKCKWLTDAEVEVYATEYGRTGFTGALQGYRVRRGPIPEVSPRCTPFRAAP